MSSATYSIVIGNSYDTNASVSLGEANNAIGSQFVSFQSGGNRQVLTAKEGTNPQGTMVNVGRSLDYTLTLSSGSLILSVTDGEKTYSNTFAIADDFDFTTIGFINDGDIGSTGIKNLKVTSIPEPASASLGLMGVAALLLRRRRRA